MSRETLALLIVVLILVILRRNSLATAIAVSGGHERAERREKNWYENRKRLP
jgi:hypothetical protein